MSKDQKDELKRYQERQERDRQKQIEVRVHHAKKYIEMLLIIGNK